MQTKGRAEDVNEAILEGRSGGDGRGLGRWLRDTLRKRTTELEEPSSPEIPRQPPEQILSPSVMELVREAIEQMRRAAPADAATVVVRVTDGEGRTHVYRFRSSPAGLVC